MAQQEIFVAQRLSFELLIKTQLFSRREIDQLLLRTPPKNCGGDLDMTASDGETTVIELWGARGHIFIAIALSFTLTRSRSTCDLEIKYICFKIIRDW